MGVAEAVGGGYCRLRMPLRLALGVRGTVAGPRLGALEGAGGGGYLPPFPMHPWVGPGQRVGDGGGARARGRGTAVVHLRARADRNNCANRPQNGHRAPAVPKRHLTRCGMLHASRRWWGGTHPSPKAQTWQQARPDTVKRKPWPPAKINTAEPIHRGVCSLRMALGQAGFQLEGGVDRAPWLDPPPPKKGSIDRTPKILPRLTPGPRR